MDRPVPEGVTVHKVDYNLMGVMIELENYKVGDWVDYGGMIYTPAVSGGTFLYGDAGSGFMHRAEIWIRPFGKPLFFCS